MYMAVYIILFLGIPVSDFVPTGSSLTLSVQVHMTEQGPKTIIQGLQPGVGLTKDHIMAIQQQVRNRLQQCNLQVCLFLINRKYRSFITASYENNN